MSYEESLKKLNDHLRNVCVSEKITYRDLANKCGGVRFNYSSWLNGNINFQPKKLSQIAENIGLKIKFEIVK